MLNTKEITLRDYQIEAIDTVNHLPDGARSICCLATGLGKTLIASRFERKGKLLWLSHRDELVRQPERYFAAQGISFGVEKADEHGEGQDVISASVQSLSRDSRLHRYNPDDFDMIICDEAHHAAAATYRKILGYFHPRKLIGLTATPKRGDGARLTDSFDDICFVRDLKWGIEHGYLARLRGLSLTASYDLGKVNKVMGDFSASALEESFEGSDTDMIVAKAYVEYCLPEHRQTLIYCPTVKVCRTVYATIKMAVPKTEKRKIRILTDKTTPEDRKKIIDGYLKGKIHAIINCMILTEGTDLPNTTCIINCRPTSNISLYQQMVGRGSRLYEGKDYCLIIDIVGDNSKFKSLCTAPTLFGVNPDDLPEQIAKQITEKEDLLELTADIISARAEISKSIEFKQEMIDFLTQEHVSIITDNISKGGVKAVAKSYRAFIEESKEDDYDFGDILVKRMYSDDRYYRISPTYHGVIYLAKPDMLGKTRIDVTIPGDETGSGRPIDFISPFMPMDDAVAFIKDLLRFAIPSQYRAKWSKTARAVMQEAVATEKQRIRVQKEYSKYAAKPMVAHLTRLEASDLINLNVELDELKSESKRIKEEMEGAEKKRGPKAKEKWKREQEEKQKLAERTKEDRVKRYASERTLLDVTIRRKKEKNRQMRESIGQRKSFILKLDYKYFIVSSMPSERQRAYADSLITGLKKQRVSLDKIDDDKLGAMTMGQFGLVIDYLVNITRNMNPDEDFRFEMQFDAFVDAVLEVKRAYQVKTLECGYIIVENEATKLC